MAIYRAIPLGADGGNFRVDYTNAAGQRVSIHIEVDRDYDTDNPSDAELIEAKPQFFAELGVEQATAAPGEKRTTKRRTTKKKS